MTLRDGENGRNADMTDIIAALGSWPFVANVWCLTAVTAASLLAFIGHSPVGGRFLRGRDTESDPSRFERFSSRRDGRLLAIAWVALVALTIGGDGVIWTDSWEPVRVFFAVLQPLAGIALVPMTAALYLFKRSVPQIARDASDEREREIQGRVYRRVHALLLGSLVVSAALLLFNPAIADLMRIRTAAAAPLDVVIPTFLVLYMLPSVAYAWMFPHREEETPSGPSPVALGLGGQAG
jgi:hypothetical protein